MRFSDFDLDPIVLRGLDAMGYDTPTPVQEQVLPAAIEGLDVVALAPTGTGKTLAYGIPIANRLLREPPPKVKGRPVDPRRRLRALVLVPVRELGQQVAEEARTLVKGSVLRSRAVYGKSALKPQREAIEKGVDVLVGTPGRLRELLDTGALSLAHVRQVVVDEADRMLDMGFLPQVRALLERVPEQRQMIFASATMPAPVAELAKDFLQAPFRVEIAANTVVRHVGQHSIHIPDLLKVPVLLGLLEDRERRGVLIFASTRRRAGWVATALRRHGLSVGLVHGNRSQAQRERAIAEFTSGELRTLVATDVAARGLHIPAIRTVINYDLPVSPEEYVHRVGRAGHGGGFGESFTLVSPSHEEVWPRFRKVAGVSIEPTDPPPCASFVREADIERMMRFRNGRVMLLRLGILGPDQVDEHERREAGFGGAPDERDRDDRDRDDRGRGRREDRGRGRSSDTRGGNRASDRETGRRSGGGRGQGGRGQGPSQGPPPGRGKEGKAKRKGPKGSGARGGIKRRGVAKAPIDRSQKPGTGVRRPG